MLMFFSSSEPTVVDVSFPRANGDVETAVVNLIDRLAPVVPVAQQPCLARKIAGVIASNRSSMGDTMFLRQSIIRRGIATRDHVIDGLAAWITVLFDLGNLRIDRRRALDVKAAISDEALDRLAQALSRSRNGCILAVPHVGSLELLLAHLNDRGFDVGFVYKVGDTPTPTEQWINEGRRATRATPIQFGKRNTGAGISKILGNGGVVVMVVDVYPSAKYSGIRVTVHDAEFNYPPGPARYARSGTLVLPAFATSRNADGFSMDILDPIEYRASMPAKDAAVDFMQSVAGYVGGFTAQAPAGFWLWHPIINDPFLAIARRQRPDLISATVASLADDEATALALEALSLMPATDADERSLLPAG
jgi:lauroyl/myristoyl acyltransferase